MPPEKLGFSVCVVVVPRVGSSVGRIIVDAAAALSLPVLSTEETKNLPDSAGYEIEVAGRAIFCILGRTDESPKDADEVAEKYNL